MIGRTLSRYTITAHLGSGGMGDVYRATDTTLGRDVAIKVLRAEVAHDPDRLARFDREARVLASINHPHIAAVYGLEEADGQKLLVMELVEGETLKQRIARGPMPLDEAVTIASQICEALDAAHERGLVHRDLKPANVKLAADGAVKVLDFGLAKAMEADSARAAAAADQTTSAATTSPVTTRAGVVLGSAAYMSPEQARGRAVDRRTDIFSLGSVVFEMLTGRRAFTGDSAADVMGAVLRSEPNWAWLPGDLPPGVRRVLASCLEKDPRRRRRDARDVMLDLQRALAESEAGSTEAFVPRGGGRLGWIAAAAFALIAIAAVTMLLLPASVPPEVRLEISTDGYASPAQFALSPDGRSLVYVARIGGVSELWLRQLDTVGARKLAGTEGAAFPFWSADSAAIGFFAGGELKRIDIAGGSPRAVTGATTNGGGAWNREGVMLVAMGAAGPLFRVPASGGEAAPATTMAPNHRSHRLPSFLPDGRRFLYFVEGAAGAQGIYLGSLDGRDATYLAPSESSGVFLPPRHVAFVREDTLFAIEFDPDRGQVRGEPQIIASPVAIDALNRASAVSASDGGLLAYRIGEDRRVLRWYDQAGQLLEGVTEPDSSGLSYPELAPDGRQVAVDRLQSGNRDVWLLDLARRAFARFTLDPTAEATPVWSPDGRYVAYRSNRSGPDGLYRKPVSSAGQEESLHQSNRALSPQSWSGDGRFLLYHETASHGSFDLWALPLTGADHTPVAVATTPFDEWQGEFSPDGKWVAYTTTASGRPEVVVQSFPEAAGRWPVSTSGGAQPRWRRDGKEIYFLAPDGRLMAAAVRADSATFEVDAPRALFQARAVYGGTGLGSRAQYAVSAGGRFLINEQAEDPRSRSVTILLNWKARE
jgi:Tol biopolymer transport system component